MKKNFYFLCGLPRSGNTLLGAILNQNTKINLTSNTILTDVIYQIVLLRNGQIYNNFPDEQSLNNIIKNIFNNYYKDWKAKFIIDRGVWGTPDNLKLLKSIIKKPKFIILYRPVLECLASFIKIEKPVNVEARCRELMDNHGMIGKGLWSIKNLIKEKEDCLIINYYNLVSNPLNQINKIYSYLNIDSFEHKLKNFNSFSANNIKYNDSVLTAPLHTIRTNKMKLNKYKIEDYLPTNVIKQYSNLDI
jgi:sulfotransferase